MACKPIKSGFEKDFQIYSSRKLVLVENIKKGWFFSCFILSSLCCAHTRILFQKLNRDVYRWTSRKYILTNTYGNIRFFSCRSNDGAAHSQSEMPIRSFWWAKSQEGDGGHLRFGIPLENSDCLLEFWQKIVTGD